VLGSTDRTSWLIPGSTEEGASELVLGAMGGAGNIDRPRAAAPRSVVDVAEAS
jgi:hypothetical protein